MVIQLHTTMFSSPIHQIVHSTFLLAALSVITVLYWVTEQSFHLLLISIVQVISDILFLGTETR